jgi:adenylate kinase
MRIIITGTPGTGKSLVAKLLAKKLEYKVINERDFCKEKKIGKFDKQLQELVVPLGKMAREMNKLLKKKKNIIIEGHLLCEAKLNSDIVVLLRVSPDILEERLRARHYPEFKIQDNVLCEGIDYCKKHAQRNYAKQKIFEMQNNKELKKTIAEIAKAIKTGPQKGFKRN